MLLFMFSVISTTSLTEDEICWLQTNQSATSLSGKKLGELADLFFCEEWPIYFLGMSRRVQVLWTTIFLMWYQSSSFFRDCTSHHGHVRSELDLPMDTSVPAQDIFLCCQDCLARTESERAFYAAAKRSPPARLFILKKVMLWISLETNM